MLARDFIKLVEAEMQNPIAIEKEFKQLAVLEHDYVSRAKGLFSTAFRNMDKNRYTDVLANENTRVSLNNGTYVNANFIVGNRFSLMEKVPQINYIATQGPLPHTISDFWTMILEQQCHVIVMLTDFEENNMIKCYPYFPQTENEDLMVSRSCTIRCTSTQIIDKEDGIVKYNLQIISDKEQKFSVSLFQYKGWRDFGTPPVEPFLQMHEAISKEEQLFPQNGPICVHCSAGVGRTGTYISIDMCYKWLKTQQSSTFQVSIPRDLIQNVVYFLKTNRYRMVQRPIQYLFIYAVLCRYLMEINI